MKLVTTITKVDLLHLLTHAVMQSARISSLRSRSNEMFVTSKVHSRIEQAQ